MTTRQETHLLSLYSMTTSSAMLLVDSVSVASRSEQLSLQTPRFDRSPCLWIIFELYRLMPYGPRTRVPAHFLGWVKNYDTVGF